MGNWFCHILIGAEQRDRNKGDWIAAHNTWYFCCCPRHPTMLQRTAIAHSSEHRKKKSENGTGTHKGAAGSDV